VADETQIDSIIAIDVGSVNTKAVLVARVEGAYRFIARAESATTIEAPWSDAAIGTRHALEKLSVAAGRPLLDERGDLIMPEQSDGAGVDTCVVTASAGQPLRVVLAGLAGEWSLESLRRAALGTYSLLEAEIALSGDGKRGGRSITDDRIQRIYDARADVVCVAGGTDGGAERSVLELVEVARIAARFLQETGVRPRILFAGNANLKPRVKDIVGDQAELLQIDNVRPSLEVESIGPVQTELEVMYATHKMGGIAGLSTLLSWSTFPALPSARAFGHIAQHLSAGDTKHGVLGVDVGGATTSIAAAFDGQLYMTLRSDVGTSFGGVRFLREVGWEKIARWLDFEITEGELRAFVINKELRPNTIPQEARELHIEQAIAREAVRAALRTAHSGWPSNAPRFSDSGVPLFQPIIGSGGALSRAPRPGQAALLLLDAVEPVGVTTLALDVYGLGTALGAAAMAQPLAAVQALEQGGLLNLATVVAPVGRMRAGEVALNVKLAYDGGGTIEDDVKAGSLSLLPLSPGQKAVMHLRPRVGVDIGRGPGRGGRPIEIQGSALGLIVDARGRPLTLPADSQRRLNVVKSWLWDVGA
jgi:uncharacterized protein (TIGR01319 family)